MANTGQISSVSEETDLAVKQLESSQNAVQSIIQPDGVENSISSTDTLDSKSSPAISVNSRPTLVQLGSNAGPAAPHPKKYSASNINKKFLEKNPTSSTGGSTLSSAISPKPGARPTLQSSSSPHLRLVTTKLTATTAPSPGPGWSRPSSVTPPVANSSSNGAHTASQASTSVPVPIPAAPQLPHAGKVIQPQPRSAGNMHRETGHIAPTSQIKPVWGNANAAAASATRADPRTQSDFPTAAEVAQGRNPKLPREKESEMVEASKQARMEEADTFRGVHLDPNTHHWDEMEEDDDNFLDGVIEFGDGRQYKVDNNTDSAPLISSPAQDSPRLDFRSSRDLEISEPVSKEDRFADDFDRSWPRGKGAPSTFDLAHPSGSQVSNNISPSPSHSALSPVETSRVLYNDRSNRLEPYNNYKDLGRSMQGSDSRFVRNSPPFHGSGNNIQLLQKPVQGEGYRSRGGYNGTYEKQREREGPHRTPQQHQQQLPHRSPRTGPGSLPFEHDTPPEHRGRRLSNMDPPPIPPHAMNRSPSFRANGRELPPHLANYPPTAPSVDRRQSSRESRHSARPPSSTGQLSVRHPSQSPVLSHTAAVSAGSSPVVSSGAESSAASGPSSVPQQLSGSALEDVKKELMHSAAARAKQRRQQEEEEREKEKERARRKAAELEARLTAQREKAEKRKAEQEKAPQEDKTKVEAVLQPPIVENLDQRVSDIDQEVVSKSELAYRPPLTTEGINTVSFGKPRRLSSTKVSSSVLPQDIPKPSFVRKSSSFAPPTPTTPSDTAESWRIKSHAPPIQTTQQPAPASTSSAERPRAMSFATPPPSALDQVQSISDLEVVDYSDLAKFVGVPDTTEEEIKVSEKSETDNVVNGELAAAVANALPSTSTHSDTSAWSTNNVTRTASSATSQRDEKSLHSKPELPEVVVSLPSGQSSVTSVTKSSAPLPTLTTSATARRNQYKEAQMSALDDVMSRIKGALDVMHEQEHKSAPTDQSPKRTVPSSSPLSSSKPDRWIPPAFRGEPRPTEVFATTRPEPSKSPKPVWNVFAVNLPTTSTHRDPVSRRQMNIYNRYQPVRWDILSFIPPVDGMSKKTLSLNDVLFQKSYAYGGYKGKLKYPVSLPKAAFRVNIPSHHLPPRSLASGGAFGKSTGADGASTWRKPTQLVPAKVDRAEAEPSVGLDTTSRSPPPGPEPTPGAEVKKEEDALTESEDASSARMRARSQPKMPAGSGVAFYRNAVVNAESGSKSSVSFFATVELEIPSKTTSEDTQTVQSVQDLFLANTSGPQSQPLSTSSSAVKPSPVKSSPSSSQYGLPSLVHSGKAESKSSEDSPDRVPITPPAHHTSPWPRPSLGLAVKESPVRGPDPEHLKAVWSQTSNQPGLHPVNSLDGITDDLPSVPFTIQDVKSEDGETPPPTTVAPSRMSLHDVTRAFQQVPSSSSIASHRPTISPPSTTAPVARPTPATYSYHPPAPGQPPSQNVRPQYPYHPSPMMSHSPAPGGMYSHPSPIPSRMHVNGHTPLYSPVWMPLQSPNTQNSPMMRSMASAYPTPPLMPYHPSPGAPQPIYAMPPPPQNMPPPSQHQQNGTPTRGPSGRTVSMMSPHSVPAMYPAGSPVMMPVHTGRGGGGRNDGPQHQQHPAPHHHQPQSFVPAGSFNGTRPAW